MALGVSGTDVIVINADASFDGLPDEIWISEVLDDCEQAVMIPRVNTSSISISAMILRVKIENICKFVFLNFISIPLLIKIWFNLDVVKKINVPDYIRFLINDEK